MNEFIEFRNHIYDCDRNYVYPLLFLDNYINKNEPINSRESILIKRIRTIMNIECKNILKEKDINELCSFLGDNPYIDRIIIDTILKFFDDNNKKVFEKNIKSIFLENKYNNQKLYHILDLCIECNLELIDYKDILFILDQYKLDLSILSNLLDYIGFFKKDGVKDYLYKLLKLDYPDNIKLQILNVLVDLLPTEKIDYSFMRENIRHERNDMFYDSYIHFLNAKLEFNQQGISILQSMFYGDFENSGKGNNGGLAVLLKDLGDEITKDSRVSFVITITIIDEINKPFISYYGEKHIFARLPIYLDKSIPDLFIKRELYIKRYIASFLKKVGIEPDIFHIRYLDNASKAVAQISKDLNKKLVFTLTPDPHRNMFDTTGHLRELSFDQLIEKLNKIKIGDELIYKCDSIVGIGGKVVEKELQIYFPQFKEKNINKKLKMLGEGIHLEQLINDKNTNIYSSEFMELNKKNKSFFEKPIILNVGRLSIQKGQIELLKAWSSSRLSQTHNLLLIGGDLEKPSIEENLVISFFKVYLEKHPEFKGRFIHKGAMSNESIRLLEKNIIKIDLDLPHIYLCSSLKEEFGIAILEAMSKGFLTIGPIKGGVKTYIKNGYNGFLIDTRNWETIGKESEKYIYYSKINKDKFKRIQAAGQKTVRENFSMKKIANEFLTFYLSLKGVKTDEV